MLRLPISFAVAVLSVFVAGGAVAIYRFEYFERAWGRFNSLQVYIWIGLGAALAAGCAAWAATVVMRNGVWPGWRFSVSAALVSSTVGALVFALTGPAMRPYGLWGLALYVSLLSFLFSFASLRWHYASRHRA